MINLENIELFINEDEDLWGVEAISLVHSPAMEKNWVALNEHKVQFKTLDEDKRIIIGLALIPNKKIYRRNKGKEYTISFSEDTVRKASELYLKRSNQHKATLEHQEVANGVCLVESWLVQDTDKDKTALYNLNAPVGSWAVTLKIDNDDIWARVKAGEYLGFSIEGMFDDKLEISEDELIMDEIVGTIINETLTDNEVLDKLKEILK